MANKLIKRELELQQLKAQLNPHFLFNTLNNICSYALSNSNYGNELILKLSELMRFILDTSEKENIKLEEEVRFIENYIAFESERLNERCLINYSKNILFENRQIAPLILFSFVENALKHGTNTLQKTSIDILLNNSRDCLKLVVRNHINSSPKHSTKKGLANATRRLEMFFP